MLVEDNPGDVLLLKIAIEDCDFDIELIVANDGDQADEYVGKHKQDPTQRISLVLLDLNLPKRSGLELLNDWKSDSVFGTTPVMVLTSSLAPNDIRESYRLGANTYLRKPDDIDGYRALVKVIYDFWFKTVSLPA
jgi:CheY-like chemotaxis protein